MRWTPFLPLFAVLPAPVVSWGMMGHQAVALLASRYFLPETARFVKEHLNGQPLTRAATWADAYSHTANGRYSAPWHYIDAKDDPPRYCGVQYKRDCKSEAGCIISALVNQTDRVMDKSLSAGERNMALKWVIHFVADIHQPLHTEDILHGGNGIRVIFDGQHTNLHHVWDTSIPTKHLGGGAVRNAVAWANTLDEYVSPGGKYSELVGNWTSCVDPSLEEECALVWANESNDWVCKYVLPDTYPAGFENTELGDEYFEGAEEIVDELVAKAGLRLAAWLNFMVTGKPGISVMDKELEGFAERLQAVLQKWWSMGEL
ncbi:hypothetical protein RUND412_007852 [Rhizina undulata]